MKRKRIPLLFPILDYLLLDHLDRPKISFELFILMKEYKKEGLLPFFHFQGNKKSEMFLCVFTDSFFLCCFSCNLCVSKL